MFILRSERLIEYLPAFNSPSSILLWVNLQDLLQKRRFGGNECRLLARAGWYSCGTAPKHDLEFSTWATLLIRWNQECELASNTPLLIPSFQSALLMSEIMEAEDQIQNTLITQGNNKPLWRNEKLISKSLKIELAAATPKLSPGKVSRWPTLQHSFELAQSYHGNNLIKFQAITRWEMPLACKGIDNEKGGYPKTKFGRCAEGKLYLACSNAARLEKRGQFRPTGSSTKKIRKKGRETEIIKGAELVSQHDGRSLRKVRWRLLDEKWGASS